MGLVYQEAKALIKEYIEETIPWTKALVDPGKVEVTVKCGPLSAEEVELIVLKIDQLAMSRQHEGIAVMLAEEFDSILTMIRWVKGETKAPFSGILGVGAQLDIRWLRPKDVGATWFTSDTGSIGLYAGTAGAVYPWLKQSLVADTSQTIIPEQTLKEEVGLIMLGAIDPVEVPKYNMITFTLSGIAAPAQPLPFNIRPSFGIDTTPFIRFEKPIIVGPEKKFKVEVMPNIAGDSKFELLALVAARAQDMTA